MSAQKGKKQTPEHVAKRTAAMLETRAKNPWKGGRPAVTALNFWDRVQKGSEDECWPWTGPMSASTKGGMAYGRIDIFGLKGVYVHRVAYWLANGGNLELRKKGDHLVRHSCDNPICCNPRHLLTGTHLDNMRDKVERGRQPRPAGPKSPRAKLSEDDVRFIRANHTSGGGSMTGPQLQKKFSVSKATITGVLSGRHYSDVT